MSDWDDAVLIGVIARTHGNRGEVIVNSQTDFPEDRFRDGAKLMTRRTDGSADTLEVVSMRMHQGRPVIMFKGIASMNDAEVLAGLELRLPEGELEDVLDAGAFYHRDLIGCEAITDGGEVIGTVAAVEGDGNATRFVVRSRRGEVLIPFADEICTVDLARKRITVRPPKGLLDVNGDWR